jgi:hypothetical protein
MVDAGVKPHGCIIFHTSIMVFSAIMLDISPAKRTSLAKQDIEVNFFSIKICNIIR